MTVEHLKVLNIKFAIILETLNIQYIQNFFCFVYLFFISRTCKDTMLQVCFYENFDSKNISVQNHATPIVTRKFKPRCSYSPSVDLEFST